MTSKTILTNSVQNSFSLPNSRSLEEEKIHLIKRLVKHCLIETASIALLTKATCLYITSPQTTSSLYVLSIFVLAANILLKSVMTNFQYQCLSSPVNNLPFQSIKRSTDALKMTLPWIGPINFSIHFGTTGNLLIHEIGHVRAASLVYQNLKAQITVQGLFRGAVSWTKTGLTDFGSLLGGLNARLLVCISGPLAATLLGTGVLLAGIHFKDRFPELSKYLTLTAVGSIAYQSLYAMSAFWASKKDLSHDFTMLWHIGVNPVIASGFLVCIPLIAVAAYFRLQKTQSSHQ